MEFYESTYFIILIPSVVITVIFLFFWLFMKETLYDEVLAKQKRDLKFPPSKADKKKTEKKKNKKKEAQNGNIHESDSESAPRDFKLSDALSTDEEPVPAVPSGGTEAPAGLRERKKKEKKHKANQDDHVTKDSEGSKSSGKKVDPVPVTKQPTPPSEPTAAKKKPGQKKQKNGMDDQDSKTDSVVSPAKKQEPVLLHQEIKQENVSGKKKVSAKKQKVDNVLVDEPLIQATTYIPLMDNSDSGTLEKREPVEVVKHNVNEGIQKSSGKKLKNETDKENAEVKFKDFVTSMKNMIFSEDEARCVVEVLKEKSGAIHDFLQKASKAETAAALHQLQDKEKMLTAVKEEAAVAKEQCKQLSQVNTEMLMEKERNGLLTAKMRERINALEKEHGTFQSKIHVSYQESQQMKMKFQQLREQMEAEISHLKQENGILRDAVSTSTNQMESKQSAELNKLRQDYARLMNELGEKSSKLQQEELQKKNAEQAVAQLKVQQQEAERRWEEIQAYLRKRTAEHEAAQQDVQNKLVAKDNEIQSLHSKLTDTMVSKQQLEQRMLQLLEAEQKRATEEDSMQMQVQLIEQNDALNAQLQKFHSQMAAQVQIAEKDKQIKQMEDSLGNERANLTSKEEELKYRSALLGKSERHSVYELQMHFFFSFLQVLQNMNLSLKSEVQKLQALTNEQTNKDLIEQMEKSMRERDDKIKTVEELLEAGLIQVATKEEELKALRTENSSLRKELQSLQIQQSEQVPAYGVSLLFLRIHEKDGKIKSVEELLQAEILKVASKEKAVQVSVCNPCNSFVCWCHNHICLLLHGILQVAGKEKEIANLQSELASQRNAFEQQRKKNNDLREKNWEAMEALASTEKLLQDKVNKTAKEKQQHLEAAEVETRQLLQKLFPKVSLPPNMVREVDLLNLLLGSGSSAPAGLGSPGAMEQKLKEAEEMHILLQLECEKYKSVLAETEGILQRLQRSVEEEESKWKIKVEESQKELKQMRSVVTSLQHEVERLKEENKEVETLKKEREHLESELEKAEIERSTYVSEVRELKDLLTELQKKLDDSYSEAVRQNEELNLVRSLLGTNEAPSIRLKRRLISNPVCSANLFSLIFLSIEIIYVV
uniref:Ribosome receptor lysine/proline rich domain-containing protein n=1 Tax=Geospiza parvula TaxID=87175 RepID=A0A8C3N6Q4_GEOPR